MARNIDVGLLRGILDSRRDRLGDGSRKGALSLTQAAVSQQIKRLEESLGRDRCSTGAKESSS